ncbi:glutamate--tRNA ligase family protein [Lentisphaerota bacterium WC36G]|nr:glutamate--tRNA ligase [Lentisphaerae bacterium WC36]
MNDKVRVRFAPSPTGKVHIGNIRTAIFNWLFARHEQGKFLVRVEDTDIERSTSEAIEALFECLKYLNIDFDEEVVYQTKMADKHLEAAQSLADKGLAYYLPPKEAGEDTPVAFRIPFDCENIAPVREVGPAEFAVHGEQQVRIDLRGVTFSLVSKKGKAMPEQTMCLAGFKDLQLLDDKDEVIFTLKDDMVNDIYRGFINHIFNGVVKMKFTRREVYFNDVIKGELAKPLDSMKDLIIVRSDGTVVFHIANVCDDNTQNITHIIRGDDHVENTYRHIFLFAALGYNIPKYGHMPMIVNKSGKPYSKRDGDAFVGDFKSKGYNGEALFNYLALLGWSPGDDREKMTRQEMIEAFTLERVKSSTAQFDIMKLENMNGLYLAEMPIDDVAATAIDFINQLAWGQNVVNDGYFVTVVKLMAQRLKVFTGVADWEYFFTDDFTVNEKVFKKQFKNSVVLEALTAVASSIKLLDNSEFNAENIEKILRDNEERFELGKFKLNLPLRLAISGTNSGADLIETALVLGEVKIVERIDKAVALADTLISVE